MSRDQSDPNGAGNHRKNLVLSLETSLRRLRTDYMDVYWVHIWDARTPVEETMRALDDAVRAGKVLYIGISDTPAWIVARAILSGKFTRPGQVESGTRISPESIGEHDRAVAQTVQDVADDLGATPSQVAIAWTMAHTSAVHPILGARRLDQLLDNLGAADCKLPPHAVARLEEAAKFTIGFPSDFLAEIESWAFGEAAAARIHPSRRSP